MTVTRSTIETAGKLLEQARDQYSENPKAENQDLQILAMKIYVYRWLPNYLIQEVIDWILENTKDFQEMLDLLAGYPDKIKEHAEGVRRPTKVIGQGLMPGYQSAADRARQQWEGSAAEEFSATSAALLKVYGGYAALPPRIAELEMLAAANVAAIRTLVRDTISDCFSELVRVAVDMALTVGAGAVAGGIGGAAVGSVFGPIGSVVGGAVGFVGGLAGGSAAALGEFIAWAADFINSYLQYLSQVLQELLGVTTQTMGQVYGIGTVMKRAAAILQGKGDPGAPGEVAEGSYGAEMKGGEPRPEDSTLAGINHMFPNDSRSVVDPNTGEKYDLLSDQEVAQQLGIDPALLRNDENGFLAGVYMTQGEDGKPKYVVVMAGTGEGPGGAKPDVVEDAAGGVAPSGQAMDAMRLAEALQGTENGDSITYTGHSLGGRLASVAAMTTGNAAVTFNSAGVSDPMIEYVAGTRGMTGDELRTEMAAGGTVRGYQTSDDPLSLAQEDVPGVAGTMHDAPGTQHRIEGHRGFTSNQGVAAGHSMDNVLESMESAYGFRQPTYT